ncbi:Methyltransferase domain-containing protein [Streptomyces sp. WMMB 714]|jgi:SAM-dependent methyltransferase|uniref:class I SAM-dependent methyltransferase n=1 Tax=Streptomyces sp. WMMB 714 TaxID=1286822 RepID=UPI0005F78CDC|nr:class I SAM-dependent methyltransferase [Streptomyces sp. WMMB 714]SCK25339.1 Methyltransferase domain-containing protein [Streptomyces sp. WMMB 714]
MTSVDDVGYGRQFGGFYDRIFPSGPYTEPTVAKLAALHPAPGERALELGVGTGRVAIPLAQRAFPVTGVDSSPEMLEQLTTKAKEADADVEAVHGDIRKYTDDNQYKLVYCICATFSMLLDPDDQRAAIQCAADRLAPGGMLVVETSNAGGVRALHEGQQRTSYFLPYPEPNTGLLTYSTLLDNGLWHASHIWFEDGKSSIGSELARLTTPDEVDAYAQAAGLRPADRWADWKETPWAEDSPMFVSTYTRN